MKPSLSLIVTRDPAEVRAARRLRHAVFVEELGASPGEDATLEGDAFDVGSDHVVVRDRARPDVGVVATARMRDGTAWTGRGFDLSVLTHRGLRIVEVGRICLHPAYRGGPPGILLLGGMLDALRARGAQAVVGTASFPGADPARHLPALRALRASAPAPEDWRVAARGGDVVEVVGHADRAAMARVPSLIKTYLRAGAWVGEGAHVDRAFNAVDVCLVLDVARLRMPGHRAA